MLLKMAFQNSYYTVVCITQCSNIISAKILVGTFGVSKDGFFIYAGLGYRYCKSYSFTTVS